MQIRTVMALLMAASLGADLADRLLARGADAILRDLEL